MTRSRRNDHRDQLADDTAQVPVFEYEYGQPKNYFWTAEGAAIPVIGAYRGCSGFIVGSGPSLNLVDKSKLRYVWTLATNNAVYSCLPEFRPDAFVCVDEPHRFLGSIWADPKIQKFTPIGNASKTMWDSRKGKWRPMVNSNGRELRVRQMPNVIYYRRNEKFLAKRFLHEDTFNWGCGADVGDGLGFRGCRSVLLVAIKVMWVLGFRSVYLLGCDFRMSKNHRYSFNEQRSKAAVQNNSNTFAALNARLSALRPHFERHQYHIYNCTEGSGLSAFEFRGIDEAINHALDGDIDMLLSERTHGMYDKYESKMAKLVR